MVKKGRRRVSRYRRRRKLRQRRIIIFSTVLVVLLTVFLLFNFLVLPKVDLKGKKKLVIDYKSSYKEKGYTAEFLGKNVTQKVKIKGKVNTKKVGVYKIEYEVGKGLLKRKVVRKVVVKDISAPKMNIDNKDYYVCPNTEVKAEKVQAIDNMDGDVSKNVDVDIKKDEIIYKVEDKAGNEEKVVKKIVFKDKDAPNIELNNDSVMTLYVGDEFNDPSVKVSDNCDKKINDKVKVKSTVNTSEVGEYEVVYSVEDKAGNKNSVTRKVNVVEHGRVGTVYLTFDDGPKSGTTDVILDVLKEEGVKATFFVTNGGPDELIKRIYDEGHTLALHTASHNYAVVYASIDSYYNDLYSVFNRVKNLTGFESKIIRFPGGSSNTISRRYAPGIMSTLTKDVVAKGFRYFDWNVDSRDAETAVDTADEVYNNVTRGISKNKINMVLMHDIKPYTRDAIKRIIQYGKENGYMFDKISNKTEMVTQRVNN